MHHEGNFDECWEKAGGWYEEKAISKEEFKEFKLKGGFEKGDIFFILGTKPEKLKVGDVIIFEAGRQNPLIHRVVNLDPLQTKGDNWRTNSQQLDEEKNIEKHQLTGKATIVRVPYIGWIKLIGADIWNKALYGRNFRYVPEGLCK